MLASEGLFVAELSVPAAVFLDQETLMFDAFMGHSPGGGILHCCPVIRVRLKQVGYGNIVIQQLLVDYADSS